MAGTNPPLSLAPHDPSPSSQPYPKPTVSSGRPQLSWAHLPQEPGYTSIGGLSNGLKEDKMGYKVTKTQ